MPLARGLSVIIGFTILCSVANVCAQIDSPVVLSSTRVPVLGGQLHVYGHNFGSDASALRVQIQDSSSNTTEECTGVRIVTPNRVVACQVSSVGTGKAKHIVVTVTTTTDAGTTVETNTDNNGAFNREAPELNTLTYSVETTTIILEGINFGYDPSKVSVKLQDDDHPVLAVDNERITLRLLKKRREDEYMVPETRFAYVTIDGQSNIANMTVAVAAIAVGSSTPANPSEESVTEGSKKSGGVDKATVAGLAVGGAFAFVVASVFAAVFVVRRRNKEAIEKQASQSFDKSKPSEDRGLDLAQIVLRERAASTNEPQVISSPMMMHMKDSTTPISMEADGAPANLNRANTCSTTHSLEEVDLHDEGGIYEKNDERMMESDSSFSESSEEDVDSEAGVDNDGHNNADSSFDNEFSDSSPLHTPTAGRRNTLQMSSEFPNNFGTTGNTPPATPPTPTSYYSPALNRTTTTTPSPSPPALVGMGMSGVRARLPQSQLRRSMVPPALSLDGDSSDGSPLPSPRHTHTSATTGGKKKKVSKKGMVRVPSSRLASSASKFTLTKQQQNSDLDSPQL